MKRSLGPAALLGLGAGLLAGAIYLITTAVRGMQVDCADLPLDQCQIQHQAAADLGRYQVLVAVALACSSVAIFLLLRAQARKAPP